MAKSGKAVILTYHSISHGPKPLCISPEAFTKQMEWLRSNANVVSLSALVALLHDILIAFFVFVFVQTPVNEALVAVVLTILGFSINDTIVIYDRIRENERLTKGSMPLADLVDLSINQSLTRSINTSLCTFGAILVAYIFSVIYGIDSITDFALPMMIGVISGTYSTIFLAGPLWVMWKTRGGRTGYEH
jgi:preprotein translocase SecF subunit